MIYRKKDGATTLSAKILALRSAYHKIYSSKNYLFKGQFADQPYLKNY